MSNRNNTKSKSPQIKKPISQDKEMMKYLILQKITKPHPPKQELIVKTQPDEEEEVEDFKKEIEYKQEKIKYKMCQVNHTYKFPKEFKKHNNGFDSSSDTSLASLRDVTVYHLFDTKLQLLTDATQPKFMQVLNEKLKKVKDQEMQATSPQLFKIGRNQNNIAFQKLQHIKALNLSNTSINHSIPRDSAKPKTQQTLSAEKSTKSKQIQQILKMAEKRPLINNNFVNINANFNNCVVYQGINKRKDIRIKTEYDEGLDYSITRYSAVQKQRPKQQYNKQCDSSYGNRQINKTMDNQLIKTLIGHRTVKSQNKQYQT